MSLLVDKYDPYYICSESNSVSLDALCFQADSTASLCDDLVSDPGIPWNLVFSSPPWPNYINGSNDFRKVSQDQWKQVCRSLSSYCSNALGTLNGDLKGILELGNNIDDASLRIFEKELELQDLGICYSLPSRVRSHFGKSFTRTWVFIGRNDEQLSYQLEEILETNSIPTTLMQVSGPSTKWAGAAAYRQRIAAAGYKFKPPPQFSGRHANAILKPFVSSGQTVLDPFVGTGTTIELCWRNNINCIAIERNDISYQGIISRMDTLEAMI